jgi:hypothetical protein
MKEMLVGNPLLFAISDPLPWVSGKPILGSAGKFVVDKTKTGFGFSHFGFSQYPNPES